MSDSYSRSVILVYHSTCATSLNGSIISFFEFSNLPVIYSVLSNNSLSIFFINPFFISENVNSFISENVNSFISEIQFLSGDLASPLYLFQYDLSCLQKYDNLFQVDLVSFFSEYDQNIIKDKRFSDLEDFYSFAVPECYYSFFNNEMYKRFGQTGDLTEIIYFVRSIMFSKVVLLIDYFSNYKFFHQSQAISVVVHGSSIISLPAKSCILDIQTTGLDKDSDIIVFSLLNGESFITYYLNDTSPEGQTGFRDFIGHSLQLFDVIYVFNPLFESKFFPQFANFIDITFNKYKYWVTARKLVHLPFHHLEFDPGSGKNVPIWNRLYSIERDKEWKQLILQRAITNLLTKLAILSSNELRNPFTDPVIADIRKIRPTPEFLDSFSHMNDNLLKKKILYYPTEFFNIFLFADGKYSEMYLNEILFSKRPQTDNL